MTLTILPTVQTWRTGILAGAFFLSLAQSFIGPPVLAAPGTGDSGQVIAGAARVVDGDTLDIGGTRVRLEGIDAPESAQTCQRADGLDWACGQEAAGHLRSLIGDAEVSCTEQGLDKYGRVLGYCSAGEIALNAEMVSAGYAWAFVKYSSQFVANEQAAREAGLGVWQGAAQAPWDWRSRAWDVAANTAPAGCAIKGNISDKGRIYHAPWSPWYAKVRIDETRGERWFCSEADALAAGWRAALPN